MISEFQCIKCGLKFGVTFITVSPGLPVTHCVACGSDKLTFQGIIGPEEQLGAKGEEKLFVLTPQLGIRYCFEVGQRVLVREGTRWITSTIEKITVYRGQAGTERPVCPHCAMPLLGEPRFWFKHHGNVPINEIMAREDIDADLGSPRTLRIIGKPTVGPVEE